MADAGNGSEAIGFCIDFSQCPPVLAFGLRLVSYVATSILVS